MARPLASGRAEGVDERVMRRAFAASAREDHLEHATCRGPARRNHQQASRVGARAAATARGPGWRIDYRGRQGCGHPEVAKTAGHDEPGRVRGCRDELDGDGATWCRRRLTRDRSIVYAAE